MVRSLGYALLFFAVAFSAACTSGKVDSGGHLVSWTHLAGDHRLERSSGWAIDRNVDLYVALPPQEWIDESLHTDLAATFQRYYPKTRVGIHRESLQQSFASARYAGMDFLVYPNVRSRQAQKDLILYLETGSGFSRGKLNMDILIFAANNEQLVDHLQIETSVGLFAEHESEKLWVPLNSYLKKLSQF